MSQRRCSSTVSFSSTTCSSFSTSTPSSSSQNDKQQLSIKSNFGRIRSSSSSPKSSKLPNSLLPCSKISQSNNRISSSSTISLCWPLVRSKRSNSVRQFRQNTHTNSQSRFSSILKLFSSSNDFHTFEENSLSYSSPQPPALTSQNDKTNLNDCKNQPCPKINSILESVNVQKKRSEDGKNDLMNNVKNNLQRWRSKISISDVLLILLLQFIWILPYVFIVNYLERCLLPLRIYCYTDPDLLVVRRALRSSTEDCAAYFFAHNNNKNINGLDIDNANDSGLQNSFSYCNSNKTISIILQPLRAKLDNPQLKRVIVIRTAPRALEYRDFIRASWKASVELHSNGPVIFVTGRDGTELVSENTEHGDILQMDFEDSYRNLSTKMMDTIVNATALKALFHEIEHWQNTTTSPDDKRYLIGKVSRGYPRLVFPWLPWYVSADQYPHKCYPPFVQGSSFIISRDAALDILNRICDFPWKNVHLDDVQMGIVTNCMGISNFHREGFDVGHQLDQFTVFHYQYSRYSAGLLMEMFSRIRHLISC